jgi:hypothetical protein
MSSDISVFSEEKEEAQTLKSFMLTKGEELFVSNMPIEYFKTLPSRNLMVGVGSFSYMVMFAAYLYFLINGYYTAVNENYISLDKHSGSCSQVTKPITGSYLADIHGNWEGNTEFKYSQSLYSFKFFNMYATDSELKSVLLTLDDELRLLGQKGMNQTLTYNLLILISYKRLFKINDYDTNEQLFSFTAQPQYVFNRRYVTYDLATYDNLDCGVTSHSEVDVNTGIISTSCSYEEYKLAGCNEIIPATKLGYDASRMGDNFKLSIDLRTHSLAISVNLGILNPPLYGLEKVPLPLWVREDFGEGDIYTVFMDEFVLSAYVDPLIPGMEPLACFQLRDALELGVRCALVLQGVTLAIPTINEWLFECTSCSSNGTDPYCPYFDVVVSAIVMEGIQVLQLFKDYSAAELNNFSYYMSPLVSESNSNEAFEWCGGKNCSLISFNLYDSDNQRVNDQFYSVPEGACNNIFSTENWATMATTAPESLTETYYECHKFWSDALLDATGIASGNTTTFVPMLLLLFIPILYLYLNLAGLAVPKSKYDDEAKMAALMELASHLLRAIDQDTSGFPADGAVVKIAKELKAFGAYSKKNRSKRKSVFTRNPMGSQEGDMGSDIELAATTTGRGKDTLSVSSVSRTSKMARGHDSDDDEDL